MEFPKDDPRNATRAGRLSQLKKGPGVFVYSGGAVDHEWEPTYLLTSGKVPLFNADGMPAMDAAGRMIYERKGHVVRDADGVPMLGGEPKISTRELSSYTLRGVTFETGKKVLVKNGALALKLRGMRCFEEVDGDPDVVEEADKPRRGRPRKDAA